MKYSKIRIIVLILLAVTLTGCGRASVLSVDGTSQETVKESMRAMSDTLPEEEQKKLLAAVVKIQLSVVGGLVTPTEEDQNKTRALLHGKTAQEIINYADSIKETTAAKSAIDIVNKLAEEDRKRKLGSIHLACSSVGGDIDEVRQHVAAGTDLNAIDETTGRTPLYLAVKNGYKQIVALLIDEGADVNSMGEAPLQGVTPLMHAPNKEMLELLITKGADVNAKTKDGYTALFLTSKKEILELLIAKGADVNAKSKDGKTPLHTPAINHEKAKLLIANGANVNAKDKNGYTPLDMALGETAKLLRKNGAKKGK